MDLKRIFLFAALLFVSLSLWNAWQKDYPSKVTNVVAERSAVTSSSDVPVFTAKPSATPITTVNQPVMKDTSTRTVQLIQVKSDVLDLAIDPVGGNIVRANLLKYSKDINTPNEPVQLLNNDPNLLYLAQSGLVGNSGPDTTAGQAQFTTAKTQYILDPDQNDLPVILTWRNNNGLTVTKTFILHRGDYALDVSYQVENRGNETWTGQFYSQIKRKNVPPEEKGLFHISSFTGAAIFTPDQRYQKFSFDKLVKQNVDKVAKDGWVAMQQHYFLSAWIPDPNQTHRFYSSSSNDQVFTIGTIGPAIDVASGKQFTTSAKFYVGPEIMDRLKTLAPGLDLTIDYGWLWFISIALFWLMRQIYHIIGNWGWAIVGVTVVIKLAFFQLSAASYKSMAAMRRLQPKITSLKERYGDDRQKLSMETMELYKKEKINPLGGCLPILVQIPVFIALYWVLIESVELRQAPFILWIKDLSVKDPYYVLPVLMGLTMLLQQRLNPPPPDPMQAKVMMFMPLVLTVFFINFPAGLVLYWVVNNALSIVQQWYIMHSMEKAELAKKPKR